VKRAHIVLGLTVFTVGIFSLVPVIRATERADLGAGNPAIGEPFASDVSCRLTRRFKRPRILTSLRLLKPLVENLRRAS
jgi:hypothetical protein